MLRCELALGEENFNTEMHGLKGLMFFFIFYQFSPKDFTENAGYFEIFYEV